MWTSLHSVDLFTSLRGERPSRGACRALVTSVREKKKVLRFDSLQKIQREMDM